MSFDDDENRNLDTLRGSLRALGNRYAIEILQVLSPEEGDIIPIMGWDEIVEHLLRMRGLVPPKSRKTTERTEMAAKYERERKKLTAGGTLYESMNKLVKVDYVQALGDKRKKQRKFMITHEGRIALAAIEEIIGPQALDNELFRIAKVLLKHKNYIKLLPTQEKFLKDIENIEDNIIIQMPPGSGKTFLAMVAVLSKLQAGERCLYISPYLSLNNQVINEYGELLKELGYRVARHDGSQEVAAPELENAQFVVGVYEAVLSSVLQGEKWTTKIKLVIVDELTELDSPIKQISAGNLGTDRSSRLDLLISLLKEQAQVITLSSRFGDTESVANWLNATVFRPSVRLSPDEFIVTSQEQGIRISSSDGAQERIIEKEYTLESIIEHLGNYDRKAILIVVSSRYQAVFFAGVLSRHWPRSVSDSLPDYVVGEERDLPVAGELYGLLKDGVAFHHAGLSSRVRARLEEKIKAGEVKSVVSTTGITAGISFPFDCVVILFDRAMGFLSSRARYLQIAGRIGEYHLAKHGGSVYLAFEEPSRTFRTVKDLEDTLLHKPLEPIRPGGIHPSILANLIVREAMRIKSFSLKDLKEKVLRITSGTFRAVVDEEYSVYVEKMCDTLLEWMELNKVFEAKGNKMRLSAYSLAAARAGLGIIRYLEKQKDIDALRPDDASFKLIEIILSFDEAQIVRPRTSYPTKIEIDAAGVDPPDSWYDALTLGRTQIKKLALERWIEEMDMPNVLATANGEGQNMVVNNERIGTVRIEEGDFDSLIMICSEISSRLAKYYRLTKRKKLANRMETLSKQIRYGAKADLVSTDLLDLVLVQGKKRVRIPKKDARTLYEAGYKSLSDILRKDVDPEKEGLARDRFAENSGLDKGYAKEIYKAALAQIRARMMEDEHEA